MIELALIALKFKKTQTDNEEERNVLKRLRGDPWTEKNLW